jgi:hypothetical protein
MGVHYRRTADNVGFEVYDTNDRRILSDKLIFSRLEAQRLVAKINAYRRAKTKKHSK